MNTYYVYLHKRPNGDIVYVGKGKGNRAWSEDRTSKIHSRWMRWNQYVGCPNVEIVSFMLTEEEALKEEAHLIEHYERSGCTLFNQQLSKKGRRP